MRIALLAPMPPEQTGIADYAANFRNALQGLGVEVVTPLSGIGNDPAKALERIADFDWTSIDLAHGELGGGRLAEFAALTELRRRFPCLPLSATVHDPERLVWRRARLPGPLSLAERLSVPMTQAATLLADPLCLREERRLASQLNALVTLTRTGGEHLRRRMRLDASRVHVIAHGNSIIPAAPLPPLKPLKLLYFGFIYRGKGIEDLLQALAVMLQDAPALAGACRLTLAGGSAPEMTFGPGGSYIDELRGRISELGLGALIDWALDVPAEQIPGLIQSHHVMLLPYRESKKLALLGAMRGTSGALSWAAACGRGAITSDARAFAEEVAAGNGAIFPQGDTIALAKHLRELCERPALAQIWADNAEQVGLARQWPLTAEHFFHLFTALCRGTSDVA